jgi:Zn-dependent protease/predicted transcriptional regulator
MFGKRITLFKLFGFKVHIDLSWIILAVFITWSLATGLFPYLIPDLDSSVYWYMGAFGTAGLFFSIVLHELFHSLVARRFGLPMSGITLFVFGGVAEMDDEPPGPGAEFAMAIAGPLSSVALGVLFLFGTSIASDRNEIAATTLYYLSSINFILATFNLLPAFPLDGGRILRSLLWKWKRDLRWATRIASHIGSWFGVALIVLGIVNVVRGGFITGLWQFMIGMFLRYAAASSYRQVMIRGLLAGATVAQVMNRAPVTVPAALSVREFVEDVVYRHHHKLYPVMDGDRVLGCASTRRVKEVPREEWDHRTVSDIIEACSVANSIGPDTDALNALGLMHRRDSSRLLVMDGGRLVGIVSLKDIMGYFAVKMELDEEDGKKR